MTFFKKLQLLSLLFISISAAGQDDQVNYGNDPDQCKERLTIMFTHYKQKSYDNAAASWRWCFNNCPEASKNIYIVGEKILKNKIKANKENKELKAAYVDTLLNLYDLRIKNFPGKGKSVFKLYGKKGKTLATYKVKTHYKEAFQLLDTTIQNSGTDVSVGVGQAYIYIVKKMIKKGEMDCTNMLDAYLKVLNIVNANIEKKPKSYGKLKKKALSSADKCLTCDILDSVYNADFEKQQLDTNWLDGGIQLLKEKNCTKSTILVKMMEKRFETAPSSKTAIQLAQYFRGKKENAKAAKFFNSAIEMEKDSSKLVKHYLKKARFLNATNQSSAGISTARKALALEPNNAKAYIVMGDAVVYGYSSCKELKFGGSEVYWVAVDFYNKAASLAKEDEVKSKAIKNAAKYAAYFPIESKIFMESLNDGDSYTVGCWINATTTIRHKK